MQSPTESKPERNTYWWTDDERDKKLEIDKFLELVHIIETLNPCKEIPLSDVQPLDSIHGEIFAVKPVWKNTP